MADSRFEDTNEVGEITTIKQGEVKKAQQWTGLVGGGLMGGLMSMFTDTGLRTYLETTLKSVFFPVMMCIDIIQAILAWRQAQLSGFKSGPVTRAVVETSGAIVVTAAVVGGFVATAVFATLAPILFTALLGFKTLYHIGLMVYNAYKATEYSLKADSADDRNMKKEYAEKSSKFGKAAFDNFVNSVCLAAITVSIGLTMIAAKPIFAALGVIAAGLGLMWGAIKIWHERKEAMAKDKKYDGPIEEVASENEGDSPKLDRKHKERSSYANVISVTGDEEPARLKPPATEDSSNHPVSGDAQPAEPKPPAPEVSSNPPVSGDAQPATPKP